MRKLGIGLGVSLAVHAVLVAAAFGVWLAVKPVLVASEKKKPVMATRVGLTSPLPRRGEGQGEGAKDVVAVPARRVVVAPAPPSTSTSTSTTTAGDEIGVAPEAGVVDAAPVHDDEPPSSSPAQSPLTPALSPPGERGSRFDPAALHAALAASAARCYPAAARRFHLTGEATVSFCLDGSGALKSTELASSTGQALLDTAARECVIAGAMPMPSEAAGGCYTVPVRFR